MSTKKSSNVIWEDFTINKSIKTAELDNFEKLLVLSY